MVFIKRGEVEITLQSDDIHHYNLKTKEDLKNFIDYVIPELKDTKVEGFSRCTSKKL